MAKCPNCGQVAARTEDWACQWCGYPLLATGYKTLPKTYRELRSEGVHQVGAAILGFQPRPEVAIGVEAVPEDAPEPEAVAAPPDESEAAEGEGEPELGTTPVEAAPAELEPEGAPGEEPVIEMTAAELCSAYEREGEAGEEQLANRLLQVTGVVDSIVINDLNSHYYITLVSAEGRSLRDIQCTFSKKDVPELNHLIVGQSVTVRGRYRGFVTSVMLKDCELVR